MERVVEVATISREKLIADSNADQRKAVEAMVSEMPEADLSIQKLIEERRNGFNAFTANAGRGKELFELLCRNCHQLDGQGSLIGPQLDGIGNRGAERLFEDILDPNRNVDPAFRSVNLVLKNGNVESGLFRREEGAVLVLANAAGQEFTVPKNKVERRVESNQSLMPSNFGEALTEQQLNDLIAFVLSRKN